MADDKMKSGEILLYSNGGDKEFVSVIFKDENFWLTQKAMAELFGCTADNIFLHLKNIFVDEELDKDAVTENFSVTAADVFEQCSYDYDKNSETTKAFYAFVQNKLHFAVTGKTAASTPGSAKSRTRITSRSSTGRRRSTSRAVNPNDRKI